MLTLKSGDQKEKLTFTIFDQSEYEIEVNLWGDTARSVNIKKGDIVLAKSVIFFISLSLKQENFKELKT